MNSSFSALAHAGLAILSILAGRQDCRKREVADWLTWPLFFAGLMALAEPVIQTRELIPQQSFLVHLMDTSGSMKLADYDNTGQQLKTNTKKAA